MKPSKADYEAIRTIPGEEGWWKRSGEGNFRRLFRETLEKGIDSDTALDWLGTAYRTVADQYGD